MLCAICKMKRVNMPRHSFAKATRDLFSAGLGSSGFAGAVQIHGNVIYKTSFFLLLNGKMKLRNKIGHSFVF